ncbi:hypothetical protein [Herbaspirillum rubrisubalbicans]|uniref:hypothetical protein n=1 Tax=Herbaspirillum rubrisubalbicans TaxID=80842 RepID=UPI0012E3AA4C|nr:hypothetical protein [Herbaspirillum rubrisubalbicans]
MKYQNMDEAYVALAQYLQAFIGSSPWDKAACDIKIFKNMARGEQYFEYQGERHEKGGFENNPDAVWDALDAAVFLRDVMFENTGHRIWGLKFTLFPDGKFDLEYDYTKPLGFDETEETVNGDEINLSLSEFRTRDNSSD